MSKVDVNELALSDRSAGVRLSVRVKPRSSRSRIVGIQDGGLLVAVKSPPVAGAANAELLKVLARALGVKRSALSLAAGAHGRNKLVDVAGMDVASVRERIAEAVE